MLILTPQTILLELAELMKLNTAGLLRIHPDKVQVSWSLAGVAGVAGAVASKIGAASHIKGGVVPKVTVERCKELEGIPDDAIQAAVGRVIDDLRMEAQTRLAGVNQRRRYE